ARRFGTHHRRRLGAGVEQHLLLAAVEELGGLHRLQDLHLPLAFQHARYRRGGEAEVAGQIGLAGAGAFERLLEPLRIHDCKFPIAALTLLTHIIYCTCAFCKGEYIWRKKPLFRTAPRRASAAPLSSRRRRATRKARPIAAGPAGPAPIFARRITRSAICARAAPARVHADAGSRRWPMRSAAVARARRRSRARPGFRAPTGKPALFFARIVPVMFAGKP